MPKDSNPRLLPAQSTEGRKFELRLSQLGYALVIVVVINSYTASLASVLLESRVTHIGIQGIRDCQQGLGQLCKTVCIASQYEQAMTEAYPSVNTMVFPSSKATFQGLVDRECQAALVPEHDAKARRDFQLDMLANDFILVGEPLLTISVATPIASRFALSYSYFVVKLSFEGIFEKLHGDFKAKEVDFSGTGHETSSMTLGVTNLIGPLFLFGIGVIVAFTLNHMHRGVKKTVKRAKSFSNDSFTKKREAVRL